MQANSTTDTSASRQDDIRQILEDWAETTRTGQLEAVLANHASDVLIYDVLPPLKYEGAENYRKSWGEWQPETPAEGQFELQDLAISVNKDLAFAHGLLLCGGALPNGKTFSDVVRATFCLERRDGRWQIVHQHISKPFPMAG